MPYTFIEDPSHGWLEVPVSELVALGIADKITRYSYKHNGMAYLEEDCDASTFLEARERSGQPIDFKRDIVRRYEATTAVRSYARMA